VKHSIARVFFLSLQKTICCIYTNINKLNIIEQIRIKKLIPVKRAKIILFMQFQHCIPDRKCNVLPNEIHNLQGFIRAGNKQANKPFYRINYSENDPRGERLCRKSIFRRGFPISIPLKRCLLRLNVQADRGRTSKR